MLFLTLHQYLFFPGCSLGNGNQTLGALYLCSHSRNNETKIHTKLLSLYFFYLYILLLPDLEADHDVSSAVLPMAFIRFYQFPFPHPPPSPAPTQTPYPVLKRREILVRDEGLFQRHRGPPSQCGHWFAQIWVVCWPGAGGCRASN